MIWKVDNLSFQNPVSECLYLSWIKSYPKRYIKIYFPSKVSISGSMQRSSSYIYISRNTVRWALSMWSANGQTCPRHVREVVSDIYYNFLTDETIFGKKFFEVWVCYGEDDPLDTLHFEIFSHNQHKPAIFSYWFRNLMASGQFL